MHRLGYVLLLSGCLVGPAFGQLEESRQVAPGRSRTTDADLATLPKNLEKLSLRGRLGYGSDDITDKGVAHLARYTNLRVLHLGGFGLTDRVLETIGKLTSLEELSLDGNQITGEGLRHITGLNKLRRLDLSYNPIRADAFATIALLPELTHLSVSGESRPVDDRILEHCARLTELRQLRLAENTAAVTDRGLAHLARLKHLKNLTLHGGAKITNVGLARLGELPRLRELSLSELRAVTPNGLRVIGKLTELRRLQLDTVPMDEQSVRALTSLNKLEDLLLWSVASGALPLDSLGELRALRTFRTNQRVASSAVRALAKLHHLESITEELTEISDEDLTHLARLPRLRVLVLGSPHVTAASLPTLAKMKSLRELYVTEKVRVTPEQWTLLGQGSLTECKIGRFRPPYTVYHEPPER
jgi:Leucine-rich repeat (LRR) protein